MSNPDPNPANNAGAPPAASEFHDSTADMMRDLPRIGTGKAIGIMLLIVPILAGLFVLGYRPWLQQQEQLHADARAASTDEPVVNAARPKHSEASIELKLPGDVRSLQQTAIYPRANGYLKRILVDIGDHVHTGQLLAEIDAPDVDAQLEQTRAAVEQAVAGVDKATNAQALAQSTYDRFVEYARTGGVTSQQLDEQKSQLSQAKAALSQAKANQVAAQAEVRRLETLQGFEKVTAPFDGIITSRNFDIGALLSPGNTGAGRELFRIDRTDTLRVFVNVPQVYSTQIHAGEAAELSVRNYPGRWFAGTIARTAGAIDPATRTLRFEVHCPNPGGVLLAGMYGQVRFHVRLKDPPLLVPSSALVYNAQGMRVALVADGRVHYQPVTLGRDFGAEVEVADGLNGDELVITSPGEQLTEGLAVRLSHPAGPEKVAARQPGSPANHE